MSAGRPRLFETPEKLQQAVDNYFALTDRPTLSGLAVALDMDRKTLYNYADRDEYFHIIKKARDKVEAIYEERSIYESNPTGVIFALKNMGWTDRVATDHTTKGESINKPDLTKLSDDELRKLAELQSKSGAGKA